MLRFPVRWRASRIQYLRPLSSYSLLGARAALGNGRIMIVIEARGLSPSSSSSSPILLFRAPRGAGCGAYDISDSHSACTYVYAASCCTYLRYDSAAIERTDPSYRSRSLFTAWPLLRFLYAITRRLLYANREIINLKVACLFVCTSFAVWLLAKQIKWLLCQTAFVSDFGWTFDDVTRSYKSYDTCVSGCGLRLKSSVSGCPSTQNDNYYLGKYYECNTFRNSTFANMRTRDFYFRILTAAQL